ASMDEESVSCCEISCQTDTHAPTLDNNTSNKKPYYPYDRFANIWNQRRLLQKAADLTRMKTTSSQTTMREGHFRRTNACQTYAMKNNFSQTVKDNSSHKKASVQYLMNLRGQESKINKDAAIQIYFKH
ncbi:MAG: hypothetical protein MHPSP_002449, partial [Paramarteilia canceri]